MEKWRGGENPLAYSDKSWTAWLTWWVLHHSAIEPRFTTPQISFGVAPAVLAFAVGLRTYLDTVCLTGFICCGLARLARFNATVALVPKDAGGKARYFEGLPIPSSLALVAVLSYWARRGWIEGKAGIPGGVVTLWGPSGGRGDIHPVSVLFSLWAAAMVSKTLRVPKP